MTLVKTHQEMIFTRWFPELNLPERFPCRIHACRLIFKKTWKIQELCVEISKKTQSVYILFEKTSKQFAEFSLK